MKGKKHFFLGIFQVSRRQKVLCKHPKTSHVPPKKGPFKRKIIFQPQLKMENSTIIPYINQPPFLGWRTMIQRDANVSEKNIVPLAKPGSSSSVDV